MKKSTCILLATIFLVAGTLFLAWKLAIRWTFKDIPDSVIALWIPEHAAIAKSPNNYWLIGQENPGEIRLELDSLDQFKSVSELHDFSLLYNDKGTVAYSGRKENLFFTTFIAPGNFLKLNMPAVIDQNESKIIGNTLVITWKLNLTEFIGHMVMAAIIILFFGAVGAMMFLDVRRKERDNSEGNKKKQPLQAA